MKLKNKVVIITGASSGLGEVLSYKVAKEGGKVALVARTKSLLEKVKSKILNGGGEAEYFVCDITDQNQVKKAASDILKYFGRIDTLVNNAGIWVTDELEEKNPKILEQAFKVNAIGHIYFTKEVLPKFQKQNSGFIFNVISDAGTDTPENKDWLTYTATKWAMTGYTKALKYKLEGTKIRVTGFFPAGFESNIFETAGEKDAHNQPWMMRTEDVADAAMYALTRPEDLMVESISLTPI